MRFLDLERIRDFGFEAAQLSAFLTQFHDSLMPSLQAIDQHLALHEQDRAQSALHQLKGMLSVFAQADLLTQVKALEWILQQSKSEQQALGAAMSALKLSLQGLQGEILMYQQRLN